MKGKKKIGLDFDDVIIDFAPAMLTKYNQEFGTSYTKDQMVTYLFEDLWGGDQESAVNHVVSLYHAPEHIDISPMPGAIESIQKLSEHHEFVIVTGRPESVKHIISDWLERRLPGVFKEIYCNNQFRGEKKFTKAEICKMYNINLFVDDHPIAIQNASKAGIPAILFDAPWNQEETPEGVTRVKSWEEILKLI